MKKNRRKEKDRFCGINGGIKSPRYPGDASSILCSRTKEEPCPSQRFTPLRKRVLLSGKRKVLAGADTWTGSGR